jgi:hypothetical protein
MLLILKKRAIYVWCRYFYLNSTQLNFAFTAHSSKYTVSESVSGSININKANIFQVDNKQTFIFEQAQLKKKKQYSKWKCKQATVQQQYAKK